MAHATCAQGLRLEGEGAEIVHAFTAPETRAHAASVDAGRRTMTVRSHCAFPQAEFELACLGLRDQSVRLQQGQTVYFLVGRGPYTLRVR